MTRAQAVRLAISAMQAERQRLAAQANLYTLAHCDTPALARRDQLDAAEDRMTITTPNHRGGRGKTHMRRRGRRSEYAL